MSGRPTPGTPPAPAVPEIFDAGSTFIARSKPILLPEPAQMVAESRLVKLAKADATISQDLTEGSRARDLALFEALGARLGVNFSLAKPTPEVYDLGALPEFPSKPGSWSYDYDEGGRSSHGLNFKEVARKAVLEQVRVQLLAKPDPPMQPISSTTPRVAQNLTALQTTQQDYRVTPPTEPSIPQKEQLQQAAYNKQPEFSMPDAHHGFKSTISSKRSKANNMTAALETPKDQNIEIAPNKTDSSSVLSPKHRPGRRTKLTRILPESLIRADFPYHQMSMQPFTDTLQAETYSSRLSPADRPYLHLNSGSINNGSTPLFSSKGVHSSKSFEHLDIGSTEMKNDTNSAQGFGNRSKQNFHQMSNPLIEQAASCTIYVYV